MARPSASYEPKSPAQSVLYRVVLDHLETFLVETGRLREGRGLPRFVEHEFRDFLQCGMLALRLGSGPSRAKSRDGGRVRRHKLRITIHSGHRHG